MNRLQKKCLFASLALHGLLLTIVIVGPAFLPRKPQPPNLPILTVIPSKLIDEAFYGGGNPNGRLPAPQPQVQQPTPPAPEPTPAPAPQPEPAPRQPEPEPPAPKPRNTPPKAPVAEPPKPAPAKNPIKVSKVLVRPKADEGASAPRPTVRVPSRSPSRAESQMRNQLESRFSRAVGRLEENLSSGTSIEPFGPGGGGEVYANWFQAVESLYDAAWRDPADVTDVLATVRVRVKVARNGTVLADDIVKRTGIRALDESVQDALDRVRALPPLPESATESERTFYINFKLESKRRLG